MGYNSEMSKASATVSLSAPTAPRPPAAVAPRPPAKSARENDIRWVTDLLRKVDLTPPADFAAQLQAARNRAEADDLISDQVQRAINVIRAEARAEKASSRMKSEDLVRLGRDESDLRIRSRLLENPMEKMTMEDARLGRAARARAMRARGRKQRHASR